MKKISELKSQLKHSGAIISFFCFFIFLIFPDEASSGIKKGIDICLNILIPSLFLLLCISSFFISCGLPSVVKDKINKPLNFFFGISANSAEVMTAGLTGGYNMATKWSVKLAEQGIISRDEAVRTAVFFTSPGLSFCINIAGSNIYSSKSLGIRFFISAVLSSLICAAVYQQIKKQKSNYIPYIKKTSVPQALTDSVEASSHIILNICAWVVLYYGICPLATKITGKSFISEFINLFGEVTSGIKTASTKYPAELSSFILSFGGICIFLQQLPDIIKLKINPLSFLFARITISTLSVILFSLSMFLFPISTSAFSPESKIRIVSHSPVGSFSLMLLCCVFILSVKNTHSNVIELHKKR